jgi:cell wall-associated NlpC family hydrolase
MHQYRCQINLNLYDSPQLERLATQAAAGRWLSIVSPEAFSTAETIALSVCLCEDDYPGWLAAADRAHLEIADRPYQPVQLSPEEIRSRIPGAIAYTHAAMNQPNHYLWGGTVAPNYDCSGLMQAAFASVGIWIPRDAYQQEAFAQPVAIADLLPGDLVFFGTPNRATHVGMYLGDGAYLHSSGKDQGRNGIGIDYLSIDANPISQQYYAQLRGAGRIVAGYEG